MALSLNVEKTVGEAQKEAGRQLVLNLQKVGMDRKAAKSRVVLTLDVSGSAENLYHQKLMQLITTMVAGVALNLDDNGELDMLAFDSGLFTNLPTLTAHTAETYVDTHIWNRSRNQFRGGMGNATRYANPLNHLMKAYGAGDPVFNIFITDGENQDQADALAALVALSYYGPIFVQTVGVGLGSGVRFENLSAMNELGTVDGRGGDKGPRFIDNAGFCTVDFRHATEEQVYNALLNEYPSFLQKATAKGMIPWTKAPFAQQPSQRGGGLFGRW